MAPADRKASQDALHGRRAQGDDRDERVRPRHRQARPPLRACTTTFPGSVEAYYQEAGRAGRDGKPAVCTILYRVEDSPRAVVLPRRQVSRRRGGGEGRARARAVSARRARRARRRWPNASGVARRKARIVLVLLKRHGLVREHRGGGWERLQSRLTAVDLSADLTDYEERRVQDRAKLAVDDRRTVRARSAARASSSSTSARTRAGTGSAATATRATRSARTPSARGEPWRSPESRGVYGISSCSSVVSDSCSHRHLDHAQPEPVCHLAHVASASDASGRAHLAARHERRPDERFRARVLVIAVDDDQSGAHAQQCSARRFVGLRKSRRVSRELDRGAQQCGGERIRREHEDGVAAHVVTRAGGCIASWAMTGVGARAQQEGDHVPHRSRRPLAT